MTRVPRSVLCALDDVCSIARLAAPLAVNNLALAGMTLTNVLMIGRLGTVDLAAVAVGSSLWLLVFLLGLGSLMAVNPLVAHAFGQGRLQEVGEWLRQALWLSQALAVLAILVLLTAGALLSLTNIDTDVKQLARQYLSAICLGFPGAFAFLALRFASEGVGWTRPIMYAASVGLLTNVAGNWLLIYGNLGFPQLGAMGCGAATAIALWSMFGTLLLCFVKSPRLKTLNIWKSFQLPRLSVQRQILRLGAPISVSVGAETSMFTGVAVLMGTLGAVPLAAHQIAVSYVNTVFMVPMAVGSATTIAVGQALGRGDSAAARRAGWVGISVCGLFMLGSALVLHFARDRIASLYTRDPELLPVAISLLGMALIFQVSDGLQAGAAGALRGFRDTRVPMLIAVVSYWLIAFPLAWYAGHYAKLGPVAVWIALMAGLTVAALLLTARYRLLSTRAASGANPFSP